MPKIEKVKVNVKEKVEDNNCDLSLCELSDVPVRDIVSFKRVNILDLSSNRLITLGRNFVSLTRLVKLDLSKNQLKYLPDDFGVLKNLRHLDLYDNKLEHLPLSFGNLSNLRYLDLKGNPLLPALAKVVGFCLTTKDCQDSARNTVKFLALMEREAEKVKEQHQQDAFKDTNTDDSHEAVSDQNSNENLKSKKTNKKSKSKKIKQMPPSEPVIIKAEPVKSLKPNNKTAKGKKLSNGSLKKNSNSSSTALTSILTFSLLLVFNIGIIYMIMFKNPEIADKLVEFIPHQYRDWFLTKTEFMRLHVGDWISQFRTPPEEQ